MSLFLRTVGNIFYLSPIATPPVVEVAPEVTHHVLVMDRSGSMDGDITPMLSTVEQALTGAAMGAVDVETSLISFSSDRDVTLHWSHVPVSQVTDPRQPYQGILRQIRATALTGISQGLDLALKQVKPGQTTGITLFTDGYANDPSASAETRAIRAFVKRVQDTYPNVFVNTVGYRDWCDWPLMEEVANALSGKCVKAKTFKDVLGVMTDTQALLSGSMRPALTVPAEAGTYILAINRKDGQVNISQEGEALILRGQASDADITVIRVTRAPVTYNIPKSAKALSVDEMYLAGALARAFSGLGDIRTAKEILFASGNKTLWGDHQSALTPSTLAAMNADLTAWVAAGNNTAYEMGRNVRPPHNLFDLISTINSLPAKSIGLDVSALMAGYKRRSVKKIAGTRQDDGTLVAPRAKLVSRSTSRCYIKRVEINNSDATVNVLTERPVWVQRLSDGKVFEEVEFFSLDALREYRSYTLVSSGERNVEILPVQVYTKEAWEALSPFILPHEARTFEPGQVAKIALKRFRMEADAVPTLSDLAQVIKTRNERTAEVKILSAMLDKGEASPLTATQVAALADLHISPSLYFSAPSSVHYTDKDEAVRTGQIDSYTRTIVSFGTLSILDTSDFRSGNAFLDRRYKVTLNGAAVAKPKLDTYLQGATYEVKPPGKGKDTAADAVMAQVGDAILLGPKMDNKQIAARLAKAKAEQDAAYQTLQKLVLEIGCTGLIPVELESQVAERLEADAFAAKYGIKLSKEQKEGVFYVFPPVDGETLVISLSQEVSWYTTSEGIRALQSPQDEEDAA